MSVTSPVREMRSLVLRIALSLAGTGILPLMAAPSPRPYAVEHYDVSIQADLAQRRLQGEASIRVHSRGDDPISALELDAGGLQITSVKEGAVPQWFERKGDTLLVVPASPLRADEHRTLTIRYLAGPSAGLAFFADEIYGAVTDDWMPCDDRPEERATLHLAIAAPYGMKVAASGQLVSGRAAGPQNVTEWQLDSATAPSFFGFALGAFAENTSVADGVKLRLLGAGADVIEPTTAAIRFVAERTGKPYPGPLYTQVFVHGDAARSLAAGLTILPESSAPGLAKEPAKLWLMARELAGQWYGIGIPLKDWSDVWLSDGVSAFVADAFLGQRFGVEAYQREVARSRQVYDRLRAQGNDRSLSYDEWTSRQDAGGDVPIYKGVCFLYLVHELVGDTAFWERLRLYTSEEWGRPTASENFQNAYGSAAAVRETGKRRAKNRGNSAKDLSSLFDLWVYGIPTASGKSRQSSR